MVVGVALSFVVPSLPWAIGLEIVLLALATVAGVVLRVFTLAGAIIGPLAVLLVAVQGFANPENHTVALALGPIVFYWEGILGAVLAALRILCLITATFLFTFTTQPADIAEALMQRGLPPRFGYVVQSSLQIIPQTLEMVGRIQDAQRARGLETEGRITTRARAYVPLLLPLVLSSLVATQERAMALEVRGFGLPVKRVVRHVFRDSTLQKVLRWGLAGLLAVAIALRLTVWR
jgi:energy-coupling factor transport system permease protein